MRAISCPAPTIRVACCQVRPIIGDADGSRELLRVAVRDAVAARAQLILLPELCNTGYAFESRKEAHAVAQPAHGGVLDDWAEEAGPHAVVVGGFAERGDSDTVFNSAAIVDGTGVLAVYRKAHLWNREKLIFDRGDDPAPVLDTSIGRIGVMICYDLFFPEFARGVALAGADIIIVPTNGPNTPGAPNHDNIGVSIARATAHVNRIFVAVCDRWGSERGIEWAGRSLIADPDGALLAGPVGDRPACLTADCDFARARDKRWSGTGNDAFGDLRPELYAQPAPAARDVRRRQSTGGQVRG